MSLNDPLSNTLSTIMMGDNKGKEAVIVKPVSKTIMAVLNLLKENKYLGDVKVIDEEKGGKIEVNLIGAINKAGVIKPRYSCQLDEFKKFEKRYLPAFGFGILVVSTNKGIMTQEQALKQNLGGKLIAYVY